MKEHVHAWKKTASVELADKRRARAWVCRCGAGKSNVRKPKLKKQEG